MMRARVRPRLSTPTRRSSEASITTCVAHMCIACIATSTLTERRAAAVHTKPLAAIELITTDPEDGRSFLGVGLVVGARRVGARRRTRSES